MSCSELPPLHEIKCKPVEKVKRTYLVNDVYNPTQCVYSIRDYIRSEIERARGKIILKEINEAMGTASVSVNFELKANVSMRFDPTDVAGIWADLP